jgi:ketosteroid isomerase-like protein
MSQENVEIVRAIFADWERGDYSAVAWAHPGIEFVWAEGPDPGVRRGLSGLSEGTREFLSIWQDATARADEYLDLDDERVLVLARYGGRGKGSGLDLGQIGGKGAFLFHVRHGQVMRLVRYWDRERALADLGLTE